MPIGNGGIIGPANVPTLTTASGVWSLREQQQAQGRGAWPLALAPDPYFEYTTLLLPGNGTNGANNNTFLDGSTNNFTITRNGNTTQGTFSPFSQTGWGNFATATSGSVGFSCTTASLVGQTASTFTAECWIYMTEAPVSGDGVPSLIGMDASYNSSVYLGFGPNASRVLVLRWFDGASKTVTGSTTLALNTWYHVAVVANSNALAMYVNGNLETLSGTTTLTNRNGTTTDFSLLLNSSASNYQFRGYVSNIRVCTSAVYTTSFTPSTLPLTTTSQGATNCQLLTAQDNRFIDKSSNGYLLVAQGSPSVVPFSPFNPTASWSAATYGGSGYFDGSGDYLTAADNASFDLGATDWTIELWAYFNSVSGEKGLISHFAAGTPNAGYTLRLSTSNSPSGLRLVCSGSSDVILQAAWTPVVGAWYHIAAVRNSGTLYTYVNGQQIGSTSIAITIGNPSALFAVGTAQTVASSDFNGYISNVRLVKGTAVYTGNFTPPTAPITNAGSTSAASYPSTTNVNTSFASSATSLLLNYTNAGIYDATSKNDLETLDNTVNGVRISTAQSQFGGSSIYFDGTGTDYLWIQADQPFQRFGTAPFTIELWIRLAATGSARGLVAKGTSTTGWLVSLNTSNQVVFTYGTSTITSTGTISAGVWTYIAVVREGTGANQTKIYIGGVNDGTGTVSTDFTQTSSMYIGADRTGGSLFSGYIQDVRITNGYARTVTTIPATAFPTF